MFKSQWKRRNPTPTLQMRQEDFFLETTLFNFLNLRIYAPLKLGGFNRKENTSLTIKIEDDRIIQNAKDIFIVIDVKRLYFHANLFTW